MKKIAQANYLLSCSVGKKEEDWETDRNCEIDKRGNESNRRQIKYVVLILKY